MVKDQPGDADVSWPALTFERHPWQVRPGSDVSRTQLRQHQGPYEAAVVPEIAGVAVRLPTEVLAEAEDTALAISRFDEYVSRAIPGGSELAPLSSVLLRSESASSSQIEDLTVGARQLALVEIGELSGRNAKIVASNVTAMRAALELSDRLDKDSVLTMHEALLAGSDPDHAGQWRTEQVWIGGGYAAVGPHTASFVPPHHERVEPALDDLVGFIDREDVPITVQAAIAHAQFETIHPFTDGNGRTGRALIHAMLRGKGLTRRVTVPISAGLLVDTDSYFDALGAYRRGDPVPIVRRVGAASFAAIDNGKELVDDLADIRLQWAGQITARRDAAAWRLADLLLRQPVVNNAVVVRELAVSVPAAQTAIDHLAGIGALVASGNKTRNRVWQSPEVLGALDAFAARTGRRHAAG